MRVTFQEELDQLEASLQEEGALVLRVLRGALNALAQRDVELADEVISFDDDVDRLYLQIQQEIESLLARQTPVAIDLRLVLAMLHVNLHLERMADYSVTIAKLTKLVADVDAGPDAAAEPPGDGRAGGGDDPRRARLACEPRPRRRPSRSSTWTS